MEVDVTNYENLFRKREEKKIKKDLKTLRYICRIHKQKWKSNNSSLM